MTPEGLTRLKIGGLVVQLPVDLDVADPDLLERQLRPFAWKGLGRPDVVVDHLPAEGRFQPPAGAFRVDVHRFIGGESNNPAIVPFWLMETSGEITVRGRLDRTLAVIGAVHLGMAHLLPSRDGLLLHASAVQAAGWGFVFPGPSGTGKSTAARSFRGGTVLSDEKCVVRRVRGGWRVHPVPMWSWHYPPLPLKTCRLAMAVMVRKGGPVAVAAMAPTMAMAGIAPAVVHHHYDAARAGRVLDILARLVADVPVIDLAYGLGDEFAERLVSHVPAPGRAGIQESN